MVDIALFCRYSACVTPGCRDGDRTVGQVTGAVPRNRGIMLGSGMRPVRSGQEVSVNEPRARELVARERARVESMLAELGGEIPAEGFLGRQQPGDRDDAGSALETESVTVALRADLREQLAAVGRAEERIARGMYGRSVESGTPIPDDRLEAEPLAERTVDEQRLYERRGLK